MQKRVSTSLENALDNARKFVGVTAFLPLNHLI